MNNIIQKDLSFEMSFTLPIIGSSKAISLLKEKYGAVEMKKSWSIKKPFSYTVTTTIKIKHDVNISEMVNKQHELLVKRRTDEE